MKGFGLLLAGLGVVAGLFAFSMDTSVEAGGQQYGSGEYAITVPRTRVNNLGLMAERTNYLGASGLAILVGVILYGFGSLQPKTLVPTANKSVLRRRMIGGEPLNEEELRQLVAIAKEQPAILRETSLVNGNSLLHMVAEANMAAEVDALLALKAPANCGNGNSRKPWQMASDPAIVARLQSAA